MDKLSLFLSACSSVPDHQSVTFTAVQQLTAGWLPTQKKFISIMQNIICIFCTHRKQQRRINPLSCPGQRCFCIRLKTFIVKCSEDSIRSSKP